MASISRVRASWTGFVGAPGVNTFYAAEPLGLTSNLRVFYDSIKATLPTTVTIQVEGSGDVISDVDGSLVGEWSGGNELPVSGTQVGPVAAPAGACIVWHTGAVMDGSRVVGRSFIVPLGGSAYDVDGTLQAATLTILRDAANALAAADLATFKVWHRPRVLRPAGNGLPELPAHAGGSALVTSASVRDFVAVLRSRRD